MILVRRLNKLTFIKRQKIARDHLENPWAVVILDDCTDEVQEQIDEFLQENSIYDLETEGWAITDSEMWIDCEIDIEKCED